MAAHFERRMGWEQKLLMGLRWQFSSKETLDLDTEDIKKLYANPAYLCYLFIVALMLVILHFVYQKLDARKKKDKPIKWSDVIMPCVYSVWSALFGTQSVVQAKVLAELLAVHSNGSENIFASWFTYATMLLWIMTVLLWLKRLNDALERFNPLFIIPLLQCSFIFFAIVSGGIFFKEFNTFDTNKWVGFWFGIVVMFSGLILLTPQPIDQTDDDQLHRDLMNLILEQRGSSSALQNSSIVCQNSEHNPDSEVTPRTRTSSKDETKSTKEKSPLRSPRFSKENMTKTAIDVVREVVSDSALLFQGAPSTRVYSDAMMAVKSNTEERRRRRVLLETLLEKISETPISSNGWSNDIATLIQDLNLTEVVSISPPGPDRDIKTHLTLTKEKLSNLIEHEIHQSITPREISYHEIT
jgi:uncharacterized membrane protein